MENKKTSMNVIIEAARQGNDILFGESHDMTNVTLGAISTLIDQLSSTSIQAIVLELPVNANEMFVKGAAERLGLEGFVRRGFEIELANSQEIALQMLMDNEISDEQFRFVQEFLHHKSQTPIKSIVEGSTLPYFYDLALKASARGIEVIPADLDRKRTVLGILAGNTVPIELRVGQNEFLGTLSSELDDTNDVSFLERNGVDLSKEGVLIVHRGYAHLDTSQLAQPDQKRMGFEDILTAQGREVITVAVLSSDAKNLVRHSKDGLDFSLGENLVPKVGP